MTLTVSKNVSPELLDLIEDTARFAQASRAGSTVDYYESCWRMFTKFCADHALPALPADVQTVAVFVTQLAKSGKALSTVQGHLSAVKWFHTRNGQSLDTDVPLINEVMAGIRRTLGKAQSGSAALLPEDLRKLVAQCGSTRTGLRDRAMLLLGFAGAFRRSELVGLKVEDVELVDEGMVIHIRKSKTDQDGAGDEVAIPFGADAELCPVTAVQTWLTEAGITTGGLFRRIRKGGHIYDEAISDTSLYRNMVAMVEAAGLSGKITPHSLRSGFCTAALLNGAQLTRVSKHLRHKSLNTTAKYERVAERFRDHAGKGLL